jgi:hypothetical protein
MSLKLKADGWVKRKYSPKIKEAPKKPLTDEQKAYLRKTCWEKCYKAYKNRMMSSALISDFETQGDLEGEAWIAMGEILDRFDTSKCGQISEYDVEGPLASKTLEFYFNNYFSGRVNFMACESRTHKKSRNVQLSSSQEFQEFDYNPIDERSQTPFDQKYEITGHLMNELQSRDKGFQRFFYQHYQLQCSYKELVDEYGQEECKKKKEELQGFMDLIKKKYKCDYGSPYKKGERGRKKKEPKVQAE